MSAAAGLTAALRVEVLRGELAPGAPLREEDLAARTGHSRHTVRAALAGLVAERLAVAEAFRGVRVTSFADADVVALQQLRGALEVEAVRLLRVQHGTRWPDRVLAPARAAVAAMAGEPADDWPAVAAAHAAVHAALVAAAGSPRVTEAHDRLHAEMLLLLVHVRPAYDVARLVAEHDDYLAQVQVEGEPAVRRHLEHSTRLILAAREGDRA
ncbi:DNA-binding transcriptional regulator, GntR family [Nocardioides scoriae]|uniref:DNA-binding transcriptional regulator, GntR family n=1 Tax=Nocardioides scoriae TaxID=642780 RepID=A0A1H1NNS2_9ACTN|nr:GntR family transcriptional regulator [Nocardioides scoriae]SDS00711.1 DNA-binding transcriptional regulator, GntR family [Nocardioides scoriae]